MTSSVPVPDPDQRKNILDMFNQALTGSFSPNHSVFPPIPNDQTLVPMFLLQEAGRKIENLEKENKMLRENQEIFIEMLNSVLSEIKVLGAAEDKIVPVYENLIKILTKGFAQNQKISTSK